MRKVAFEMETAGRSGDIDAMRKRMDLLESEFARLRDAMMRECAGGDRG